jgi:hypothetical protein
VGVRILPGLPFVRRQGPEVPHRVCEVRHGERPHDLRLAVPHPLGQVRGKRLPPGRPALAAGTDFGVVAPDGRLQSVTGFLDRMAGPAEREDA